MRIKKTGGYCFSKQEGLIVDRVEKLNAYLTEDHGADLYELLSFKKSDLEKALRSDNGEKAEVMLRRVCLLFSISYKSFIAAGYHLPAGPELQYDSTLGKLKYLSTYLLEKKELELSRAISVPDKKLKAILLGDRKASKTIVKRTAEYFMMSTKDFKNLSAMPPYDQLTIDEELLKIQKNDDDDRLVLFKNRHYIAKNYRLLGHGKRTKLILSLLGILIPLVAYTSYCSTLVSTERAGTVDKYRKGSDETEIYDRYSSVQTEYHQKLMTTDKANNPDSIYCDVKVGTRLYRIADISSSTNSYVTRMELYFKFDKDEFRGMFHHYATTVLNDLIIGDYEEETGEKKDSNLSVEDWLTNHADYVDEWVEKHDSEYYPGETPSNVLTDKETMFDIGNGGFVADSYGTVKDLEETEYKDADGVLRTLCYQKVKFEAKFEKAFDSYRYPLDSIQLKMYIQPTMDSTYLRYTPDRGLNSTGQSISGFSPYFKLTNGYRLINEKDGIKDLTLRVNYYQDVNNDPAINYDHTYKTQLEVTVRANRAGMSLFLQAFVNLFSVIIWIIIAFYNQSYNGEDSIGMLGTGLFGAISSILVGLSMVTDAGLFSLITMINIFTLAVIMIMTYQSIAARRAIVKKDKVQIAYNAVKLRVTFFMLVICTLVMFVGLPMISYLFGF